MAQKYRLVGTRRRLGAIDASERFETVIVADGKTDAVKLLIWNWSDRWQDVHVDKVEAIG